MLQSIERIASLVLPNAVVMGTAAKPRETGSFDAVASAVASAVIPTAMVALDQW